MIKCPRCAQPVDETVRTTCPLCFTPIMPAETAAPAEANTPVAAGAPTPNGMPMPNGTPQPAVPMYQPAMPGSVPVNGSGSGNGAPPIGVANLNGPPAGVQPLNGAAPLNAAPSLNASSVPTLAPIEQPLAPGSIRTLNGDIIQSTAPAPPLQPTALPGAPPNSYGSGGPTSMHAPRPGNLPTLMRDEDTGPKPGIGKTIYGILLALVLFGGAGWGLKNLLTPKPDPKAVTKQFLTAIASQDFKTVYDLIDLPEEQKTTYPDAQAFADAKKKDLDNAKSNPVLSSFVDIGLKALKDAKVGEPKIDNENATVPVTLTLSANGQSQSSTQDMTLKKVGGDWKISGNSTGFGAGGNFTGRAGG